MNRRVAVTGWSTISPVGLNAQSNWASLSEGRSGISRIERFDPTAFRSQIAGEIKNFSADHVVPPKDQRMMDRFMQYGVVAAHEAIVQSGLVSDAPWGSSKIDESLQTRAGVIMGAGLGGLPDIEATADLVTKRGPSRISPFFIPKVISNLAGGHIAIAYGFRGINYCTTSACSSGAHGIGESFRLIRAGAADVMICGGAESTVTPLGIGGFDAMRALSTGRNAEPEKASRPFDRGRDGFVCAEGAGVLVLEAWDLAVKRGAKILGEVVGYGTSCDAFHFTAPAPGGAGAAQAMDLALKDAEISIDKIGAINSHGTSTPLGDVAETEAIKTVFKDRARSLKVTSTKSMTGHALGAAGGLEAAYTLMALYHQVVPPTINLDDPDPECDLDYVAHTAQALRHEYALSNSFGFGGTNVSLVFRKAE